LERAVVLLPFYDLMNSNQAFTSMLLADLASMTSSTKSDSDRPAVLPLLVSLSSYIFCHAASSTRSKLYSRLCLIILTKLLESGPTLLADDMIVEVRLCRQRLPMLPFVNDQKRPFLCAILDSLVIYIRHNIRKKLDVETFIIALQLCHKAMHQLKTHRFRQNYDWENMWRAVLSLASFIVAKVDLLKSLAQINDLIDAILILLDFGCVWIDFIATSPNASTSLYYELMRAEDVIRQLGNLTDLISNLNNGPAGPATECVRNLTLVTNHFGQAIEARRNQLTGKVIDPDQVLNVIASVAEGLELGESPALEDVRPYSEFDHELFFRELMRSVTNDCLGLMTWSEMT